MNQTLAFARAVCAEAGELLLARRHSGELGRIEEKASITDLVTAVDHEVEDLIVGRILERFPDHAILTEERGRIGSESASSLWILDPLDGTRNFIYGFPFYSISLALTVEGQAELGIVAAPHLRETFWARRGGGAFLDGEPLSVTSRATLDAALFATGFACVRAGVTPNNLGVLTRMIQRTGDVRRAGSAALDLCSVAAGRLDGFWEMCLAPWDVAAGSLIVQEAGGQVSDLSGGSDFLYGRQVVASNGRLHAELLREIGDGLRAQSSAAAPA